MHAMLPSRCSSSCRAQVLDSKNEQVSLVDYDCRALVLARRPDEGRVPNLAVRRDLGEPTSATIIGLIQCSRKEVTEGPSGGGCSPAGLPLAASTMLGKKRGVGVLPDPPETAGCAGRRLDTRLPPKE